MTLTGRKSSHETRRRAAWRNAGIWLLVFAVLTPLAWIGTAEARSSYSTAITLAADVGDEAPADSQPDASASFDQHTSCGCSVAFPVRRTDAERAHLPVVEHAVCANGRFASCETAPLLEPPRS